MQISFLDHLRNKFLKHWINTSSSWDPIPGWIHCNEGERRRNVDWCVFHKDTTTMVHDGLELDWCVLHKDTTTIVQDGLELTTSQLWGGNNINCTTEASQQILQRCSELSSANTTCKNVLFLSWQYKSHTLLGMFYTCSNVYRKYVFLQENVLFGAIWICYSTWNVLFNAVTYHK